MMDIREAGVREANGAAEVESSLRKIASKISPDKISSFARELPAIVEREVKENPYRTLGVVAGVGFGLGAIVGSRLLRTALLATGGILASEIARGHIKRFIETLADEVDHESNGERTRERV